MTKQETYDLIIKAQAGDKKAKDILITNNMPLVLKVAGGLLKKRRGHGVPMEDLITPGVEGLDRALFTFDISLGYSFSTYSIPWIKQKMMREIDQTNTTIRIPHHIKTAMVLLSKFKKAYGEFPSSLLTFANEYRISKATVKSAMHYLGDVEVRLDSPIGEGYSLVDVIEDHSQHPSILETEMTEKALINKAMTVLDVREKIIITERFFNQRTLEETGKILGITRERVRQLQKRAVERMKEVLKCVM